MKFRAGGFEFSATVAEASEATSAQTGEPLRSLTIQFRAQKATMHEQALEQAQRLQTGGLFSLAEGDEAELEWRVRESTSQFVGTEPWGINHHTWRIEQVERLACDRLVIGPVELEPYEYVEEVTDDSVVRLAARAVASEADLDALAAISEPVEVIRRGISDTPRRMSVTYVWGDRPEGLGVVVRCEDAREPRVTLDAAEALPTEDVLGELVTILTAKGFLTTDDWQTLSKVIRDRRHAARRVSNPAGWRL